jgi:hypothetical protein
VDGAVTKWAASASGALVRELFHRNHPDEPLRPTANRSLPTAHLSPSLSACVLLLAHERPGGSAVHTALRAAVCCDTGLRIPQLAKATGVSIARFERLVEHVAAADDEAEATLMHGGTALMLRHLWMRASSRRELWIYLHTLHSMAPGSVLTADAVAAFDAPFHTSIANGPAATATTGMTGGLEPISAEAREWIASTPLGSHELSTPAVLDALRMVLGIDGPNASPAASCDPAASSPADVATAFEVLAAALARGGSRAAPINQGRYSFLGQPPVADCAELCARELLNALLWDPAAQSFDSSRLPPNCSEGLRNFYGAEGPAHHHQPRINQEGGEGSLLVDARASASWHAGAPQYTIAAEAWFRLLSGLPGVEYLAGLPQKRTTLHELAPTCTAVVHCLGVLLGTDEIRTPPELARMWREHVEPGRGVRLSTNAAGDRMYLHETIEGGEEECTLELVMSTRLNHAFAIHHWRPPAWQREAALSVLKRQPLYCASEHVGTAAVPLPLRLCLMPALLQPINSLDGSLPGAMPDADGGGVPPACRVDGRHARLMLLSTDPANDLAIAHSLLRVLHSADHPAARACVGDSYMIRSDDTMCLAPEGSDNASLAARLLAITPSGLNAVSDALLLRVSAAVRSHGSSATRHAALLHPPLCGAVAALCGGDGGLSGWLRAVRADPIRCLRLTVGALGMRTAAWAPASQTQ